MTKKIKSTYDKLMESMSAKEKKEYEKELKDFIISELILAAMEEDNISVRKLAKLADVSPTIVQEMRSGVKKSFNTDSFFKVLKGLGYNVFLERNGHITPLGIPHIHKK
jgi:hypothetical protein